MGMYAHIIEVYDDGEEDSVQWDDVTESARIRIPLEDSNMVAKMEAFSTSTGVFSITGFIAMGKELETAKEITFYITILKCILEQRGSVDIELTDFRIEYI
jgi:hypothetical protein